MMRKLAVRSLTAHPARYLLTLVAVTLGVAFMTGTFSFRTMMANTFDQLITASPADAYIQVPANVTEAGVSAADFPVPGDLVDEIAAVDGVASVATSVVAPAVLVGADGTAVASFGPPSVVDAYHPGDPSWTLVDGRTPTAAGEVMLERATAATAGLSTGDTTTMIVGGQLRDVEVVGIAEADRPLVGAVWVLMDAATTDAWVGANGNVSTIMAYADGISQAELVDRIRPLVPADLEVLTGADNQARATEQVGDALGFVNTFLGIFAALALFVGGFIIANTFTMTLRERTREFAMLRAVGASPRQVRGSVLLQAILVGLVGSALGLLAGMGLVAGVRALMARFGMELSASVPLDVTTVGIAVACGAGVCLAAAVLPARRAALTAPVEAMRVGEPADERALTWRGRAGALVLGVGLALVGLAAGGFVPEWDESAYAAGAVLTVVGLLAFSPVLIRGILTWLGRPVDAAVPPMGRLARGALTRHPRRTASTAGALIVGMGLVGAAGTIAATAEASTADLIRDELSADISLWSQQFGVPAELSTAAQAVPGVAEVHLWTAAPGMADGLETTLFAVASNAWGRTSSPTLEEGSFVGLGDADILVSKDLADTNDWQIGDHLEVAGSAGSTDMTVRAIITMHSMGTGVYLSDRAMAEIAPEAVGLYAGIVAEAGQAESAQAKLTDLAKPYVVVSVLDAAGLKQTMSDQVATIVNIMYALLALSVVIAVLGIINTLALSVSERTREIGLLRAVGMGRAQTAGQVGVEAVLIAVIGTTIGLALGVGLAAAMQPVYAEEGLNALGLPWPMIGATVAVSGLIGLVAAIWPAIRAARLPVLEAVTVE